jgi:dsRNA-specific ribonuclease
MEADSDYQVTIESRPSGAPKFQVFVTLDGKTVGDDFAVTIQQADEIARRMIQRHKELQRQLRQ